MDLDDWGVLLTILLVLDLLVTAYAAAAITKHAKDITARHNPRTTVRADDPPGSHLG